MTTTATRQGQRWPWVVIGIYVGVQAVILRAETRPVAALRLNDYSVHTALVRWAAQRIADGHLPLDGWFPDLGLGTPYFHQYQTLPHLVAAPFALLVDAGTVIHWSGYLLLVVWPLLVFVGVRMLTNDDIVAVSAGILAPLVTSYPSFGFEYSSYTFLGYGLWPNLIGMALIPFAFALSWRAVDRGRGYALAALVIAVTTACHFLTGCLVFLWLIVIATVGPRELATRLRRASLIAVTSLVVAAPMIVPAFVDGAWIARSEKTPPFVRDSFGARRVLSWLFTGRLFDEGHTWFPIISVLAAVGVVACVLRFRRDALARAVLCFSGTSLVLFFGRPTLGPLLDLVPSSGDLFLHRFLTGVHLGGVLLAGMGAAAVVRAVWARRDQLHAVQTPALVTVLVAAVCALAVLPAWKNSYDFVSRGRHLIGKQQTADGSRGKDAHALIELAQARGDGRLYAGTPLDSGERFRVGEAAVYEEFLNFDAPAVGYWGRSASVSADVELLFDVTRRDQYPLFGVRYLVVPAGQRPPLAATRVARRGDFVLWEIGRGGYLGVYDLVGPSITADRTNLGSRVGKYLRSHLPAHHATQPIAFAGDAAAAPTAAHEAASDDSPGTVSAERDRGDDGVFSGTVTTKRRAAVLLSQSYHPRWHVTVDGRERPTEMVAPSLVAVTVPAGTHHVEFRYEPYPATSYAILALLSVVTLLALAIIPRWLRSRPTRA
jgi:hypothetical protein